MPIMMSRLSRVAEELSRERLRTAEPRGGGECYMGIPLRSDRELRLDLGFRESEAGQVLSAGTTSTATILSV